MSGPDAVMYWTVGSQEQQDMAAIYSNDEGTFPPSPDAPSLTAFFENTVKQLRLKWKIAY